MMPRKNKNKITYEGECSAAANKRRRIEILNGTTGVPFMNPITQFPSINLLQQQRNPPQNTTTVNTDLQLSHPPETNGDDEAAAVDDIFSSLIPQQNFLVSFHINQMIKSVEEFWGRNFAEQVKKRKEMEAKIKLKDEQAVLFGKLCYYYEERTVLLEEMQKQSVGGEGSSAAATVAPEEEVKSSFVMFGVKRMDMACRNCRNRPAIMMWLPCRHLCVCFVCERRVNFCPICGVEKTQSFMINYNS